MHFLFALLWSSTSKVAMVRFNENCLMFEGFHYYRSTVEGIRSHLNGGAVGRANHFSLLDFGRRSSKSVSLPCINLDTSDLSIEFRESIFDEQPIIG